MEKVTVILDNREKVEAFLLDQNNTIYFADNRLFWLQVRPSYIKDIYRQKAGHTVLRIDEKGSNEWSYINPVLQKLANMSFYQYLKEHHDHIEWDYEFNF
jgi:hypothetical protein